MTARAAGLAAAVLALVCPRPASAKDTSNLWYIGLDPGYHMTTDSVRSNAALGGDPRPDRFEDREITLKDGPGYSLTAGFGLTRLLSLQLDVRYFKANVGPVDAFLTDTFPVVRNPVNPVQVTFDTRQITIPVSAGQITQIPVSLSGILRFRKDRSISPYIGAGFGKIFTQVDTSPDVSRLNDRLASLRINAEFDEFGKDLTPARYSDLKAMGKVPMSFPVTVNANDAMEWHLTAGIEYFLNDRFSLAAEARYMATGSTVQIDMNGQDQVNFEIFSEKLFREDGSLKFFNSNKIYPNPWVDPNDITKGLVGCTPNTTGDFDHDGRAGDLCYTVAPFESAPSGILVVQGGRINLSGLTINIGARFWF